MPDLRFLDLSERHKGLTPAISDTYAEAARVCLDRHHMSAVEFRLVDNADEKTATASWIATDQRTKDAWNNAIDATEFGAYAIALAGVENLRGLVAVSRAETLTGADYYIDVYGAEPTDLESCIRLEVSGVDAGSLSVINSRLTQKVKQAMAGASNLPAIACVVGFSALQILVADADSP